MHPVVALDVMGGDQAPDIPLQGAQQALNQYPDLHLRLIGPSEIIQAHLSPGYLEHPRLSIVHAPDWIRMDDVPVQAVRQKTASSLVLGVQQMLQPEVQAFVTAGNSGAAVVAASFYLERLPGVLRPAMAVLFPGQQGHTVLLDVGAQAQCRPEQLLQFARLGSSLARHMLGIARPRVGLLNIGEEPNKGHATARAAFELLSQSELHFTGNIEGWDLPRNRVDVAVCDGFVGNVVLKLAEGLSEYFMDICPALPGTPGADRFNYTAHGGSLLLGLEKLLVITHGRAEVPAIVNALELARKTALSQMLAHMHAELKNEVLRS